ncbi:MAG: conjugal transfer protein TraC [Steroidobacteraceae bacterium]
MPSPHLRNDINIRSPRFLLAQTVGTCWHCRATIPLFALAVPPGHMALEPDDEAQDEETAVYTWRIAADSAFLFYVEYLPAAVQNRLKQFTRSYRLGDCAGAAGSYWANHCEHCGSLLDDHELFCEPDGAFLPTDESRARNIHLARIDEAFEAVAAGYAYELDFFDAMA